MKYTKEILEPIVKKSKSFAEVLRLLNLKQAGGSNSHIKRCTEKFGISTKHFLGKAHNKNKNFTRKHYTEVLILGKPTDNRTKGSQLRKALIEAGEPYRCYECGQGPLWNTNPLLLTPDHRDGKFWNNLISNLRFLCPNCHSQTDTFSGRNTNLS